MANDERIEIRSVISAGYAINADYEETFDGPLRSEWEAMSEQERQDYLKDAAETMLANHVECYAEVVED